MAQLRSKLRSAVGISDDRHLSGKVLEVIEFEQRVLDVGRKFYFEKTVWHASAVEPDSVNSLGSFRFTKRGYENCGRDLIDRTLSIVPAKNALLRSWFGAQQSNLRYLPIKRSSPW